jgi:hypothetical protein
MSTKVLKDQALESYYQSLFEMYGLPGWRMLMEDIAAMRANLDTARGIATAEQLHFRQGELSFLDWLAAHQDMVERAYAQLIQDQEGGAEEAPTGGIGKVIE